MLAAQAAVVEFTTKTAIPAVKLAMETCIAHLNIAYAAAKPHVLNGVEMAKPHLVAAQQSIQNLVAVILAYFK